MLTRHAGHPAAAHPVVTQTNSSDSVTVTVTMPASVFTNGQAFNICVTPTSTPRIQHVADPTFPPPSNCPATPIGTPRCRAPKFDLGAETHPTSNTKQRAPPSACPTKAEDDPFGSTPNLHGTRTSRVVDIESDEEDLSPDPIYPLTEGQTAHAKSTNSAARYYVITKGKKIGVFFDSWYVITCLNERSLMCSYVQEPPRAYSHENRRRRLLEAENLHGS